MGPPNYFLAALLNNATLRQAGKYRLDKTNPHIHRTTSDRNLHITIGFIGPLPDPAQLEKGIQVYDDILFPSQIPLKLSGLGLYGGSKNHKKYLGIHVEDSAGLLKDIRDETDRSLRQQAGLAYRRNHWPNFKPHITLQLLEKDMTVPQMKEVQGAFLTQPFVPYTFFVRKLALWYKDLETGFYESVWETQELG